MVFLSEFNNVSKIFVSAEIWLKRRYDDAVGNIIEQGTNKKAGKTSTHNEAAVSTRRVTKIPTKNTVIQHHTHICIYHRRSPQSRTKVILVQQSNPGNINWFELK